MSCPCPVCTNMVEHVTYADEKLPEESIYDRVMVEYEESGRISLQEIADDIDGLDSEIGEVIHDLPIGCSTRNKLERIRAKLW